MRVLCLGVTFLTALTVSLAQASTPGGPGPAPRVPTFRPSPSPPPAAFRLPTPRPVATPPRPNPTPPKPIAGNLPKAPDYTKRSLALVQRNIIMMQAMRAADAPLRCDPRWSARKLARKGCPPAASTAEPLAQAPAPSAETPHTPPAASAPETSGGQN